MVLSIKWRTVPDVAMVGMCGVSLALLFVLYDKKYCTYPIYKPSRDTYDIVVTVLAPLAPVLM